MSEPSDKLDQGARGSDDCEALRLLIPAYYLGAADPDERARVERRLADCPELAEEAAEYRALSDALLFSAPAVEPPPHLLTGLLAATASPQPAAVPLTLRERIRQWFGPLRLGPALAALAIILLVATNLYWFGRLQELEDAQTAAFNRAQEQAALLAMVGERDSGNWVSLASTEENRPSYAVLIWTRTPEDPNTWVALLNAKHMPTLTPDRVYQLWMIRGETRVSAGLFRVDENGEGMLIFHTYEPIETFEGFGITQEPASGSEWPTSSPLVTGQT